MAMRCTQWPTSAVGSGMYSDCSPRLIGFQDLAAVIVTKCTGCGYRDVDAFRIAGVEHDRVQAHTACAGLPAFGSIVLTEAGQFVSSSYRRRWT